ncbi:MAG: B12-binding domain-containing protein, partial [Oscillospiraceae bacterium]|nr:B12-binding domain-containing protein [Oscillospiraceae bacterium]
MAILNDISEALQKGKAKDVRALVEQAISEGIGAKAILEEGLLPGMSIIGDKFKNNEVYVPEVLISARAMKAGTDILKPHLVAEKVEPLGKICIGTVKGDLHDIGKNLVKMMMEGKGIEVVDLGVDVSPEQFLAAVKDEGCQIVCCSALLTTTMGVMKDIVE